MLQDYTHDAGLAGVRIVAADMDATLLDDEKTQPPHMPERIRALREAGVAFVAASGRPLDTLRNMFAEVTGCMAFVSDNGACVALGDELLSSSVMDRATVEELIAFTVDVAHGIPLLISPHMTYLREEERALEGLMGEFYKNICYLPRIEDALDLGEDVIKYTVHTPQGDAEAQLKALYGPRFDNALSLTVGGPLWIDVMNKGVNKGTGIRALAERLGVSLRDVAAFGDTGNDVEMLEAAGHSFLMANADASMETHARFRAPSCNERGVATVIDAILEAKTGIRPVFA